jgi:hypothetical protein
METSPQMQNQRNRLPAGEGAMPSGKEEMAQRQQKPGQQGTQKQATPEEQMQYDLIVANGMSIIHDPKVSKELLNRLSQSADPIDAIARATLDIIMRLKQSAGNNNVKLSLTAIAHGANQLMGEIITLAESAGMEPLTDEQKYQAFSLAVSLYIDNAVKSGEISQEELQGMAQSASQSPEGQKILQLMRGGGQQQGLPQAQARAQMQPQQQVPQQQTRVPVGRGLLQRGGIQ